MAPPKLLRSHHPEAADLGPFSSHWAHDWKKLTGQLWQLWSAAAQLIMQLKTSCHSFPEKAPQKHQNPTCNAKAEDLALAIVAEPKDIYLRISQFSTKFYLGWIHGALMTTQVSSIGVSLQDLGDGNSSPQNQDLPVAAGLAISPGARQ